jgi:serine/threonine protein kinase
MHELVAPLLVGLSSASDEFAEAFHVACRFANVAVVGLFVDAGADVNEADEHGWTSALEAAANPNEKVLQQLIAAGADVNKAAHGSTPAHKAAANENEKVMQLLIDAGADVNKADKDGWTPAHVAAANENEMVLQLLIDAGADVNKAANRSTPFHILYRQRGFDFPALNADAFEQAGEALKCARQARARFAALDDAGAVLRDIVGSKGPFVTVLRLQSFCETLKTAETAFEARQDELRAATALDEQLVAQRDRERRVVQDAAAALLASCDDAVMQAAAEVRQRVARALATVKEWPTDDKDEGEDEVEDDDRPFAEWLDGVHKDVTGVTNLTEATARVLRGAIETFADALAPNSTSAAPIGLPGRARAVVLAAELEAGVIRRVAMPVRCRDEFLSVCETTHEQLASVLDAADRARQHCNVKPAPSGERFVTARKDVQVKLKALKVAKAQLEHAVDDDDTVALESDVRRCKSAWTAVQGELTSAIVDLAAHLFDYPELRLRFPQARLDELLGAGGDVGALRTLDDYSDREVVSRVRNVVERATINGEACALKLFALMRGGERAFVKEARRLRQLAHVNVVELRAVFVDVGASMGVLEMPLYAHGDLWHWLAAAPRSLVAKMAVLRATTCGLEHVHRMGVVHGDVKPENVFVTADGVAKVGDFDVSHDNETRVTMAATMVGFTLDYAAPEQLKGTPASKASDVFALGLTLHDVVLGRRPIVRPAQAVALSETPQALRDLVGAMLSDDARRRPTASEVLRDDALAPPAAGRNPATDRRECQLCCEEKWLDEGVLCGAGTHFVCRGDECIEPMCRSFCALPLAEVAKRGALMCGTKATCGALWSVSKLASVLADDALELYVTTLRKIDESRALQELQQKHRAELAEQERRLRGQMERDEEIAAHRRHITNALLNLSCPRCAKPFLDFDACFDLKCSACPCHFCGWCLRDCGNDAHQHVAHCLDNPVQPSVFGTQEQFAACHRARRLLLVDDYLRDKVRADLRVHVRNSIAPELRALGMRKTSVAKKRAFDQV